MAQELENDFYKLDPDTVIDAVESCGFLSDARILALNSFENRVYQVGIEESTPVITKFYRPNRWSDEAILEEHRFSQQLHDMEIPVVAPLEINGESLHRYNGYRFAVFPRKGGRAPEAGSLDQLNWIGRFIGRIHAVSATDSFHHRLELNVETYCDYPSTFLLEHYIPADLRPSYESLIGQLRQEIEASFRQVNDASLIRCHGDCHMGNILWLDDHGPHFVDFDDCIMAPAIQDLWMLLAGDRQEQQLQIIEILDGYREFASLPLSQLQLIEPLRTLRMIHYAGWLGRRWEDPAFPAAFPWFNSGNYWEQHMADLQDQLNILGRPPLSLPTYF